MTQPTDAERLDRTWPAPPLPDDVDADAEATERALLRTASADAKTLLQIVKLFETMEAYGQRAALDWLKGYYDEVC